jgi:hypothetical protein
MGPGKKFMLLMAFYIECFLGELLSLFGAFYVFFLDK